MKVFAIAKRILQQLLRDRRTLALMLLAPLLIMSLVYLLLEGSTSQLSIALTNGPLAYELRLEEGNLQVIRCAETEAAQLLEQGEVTAIAQLQNDHLQVILDGSDSSKAQQVLALLESGRMPANQQRPDLRTEIQYAYGYADGSLFDHFGAVLIGILVFFLVFLVAGISFVQERTSGTLEKLLSTPVQRWEIVAGYVLGFGVITVIQSVLLTLFVVYVLKVMLVGSIWLVLLLTLLSAMSALTLGILLSTAAANEFQMVQFVPVVIVPQIFLSGLFELQGIWAYFGQLTPIYYVADGLQQVMMKGAGFGQIAGHLITLLLFSLFFMVCNVHLLKKQREI